MQNNIIIIIFLLCIIIILNLFCNKEDYITINDNEFVEFSYEFSETSKIPNIIWTFWDGELIDTVNKCIDSWKFYNPNYQINILNKSNYSQFIDENINSIKHSQDSIQRYSDYIRLAVLSKYGGIWIDASIICHHPFTWIHSIQNKLNVEMIGYYLNAFTEEKYKKISPVIESWFFACIPKSQFVNDWRDEFFSSKNFDSISNYLNDVLYKENISTQKIKALNYLAIHVSAQKILQKNLNKYDICLFSASFGPYKYLEDTNWNNKESVKNLTNNKYKEYYKHPFIKLRKSERKFINNNINKNNAFSHLKNKNN